MSFTIEYDASTARFLEPLPEWLQNTLYEHTRWTNKSIDYQNYRNKNKFYYTPKPTEFYCYNKEDNSFPTGLIPHLLDKLNEHNIPVELKRTFEYTTPKEFCVPGWAFEHQKEAITAALKYKRGLISSPTGSGKTLILAFIAAQYPEAKILVVATSTDTFRNITQTLGDYLDEPIGQVGDGKSKWQRVTVGIINSLAKHASGKYSAEMEATDVLLADEVHHMGNTYGLAISAACNRTTSRIGVSGTLQRADGADLVVEGIFGPAILKIPESAMVNLGVTMHPDCYFVKTPSFKCDLSYIKQKYPDIRNGIYTEGIVKNLERNKLIVDLIESFISSPVRTGSALVLVQIIRHGEYLQKLFQERGLAVPYVHGESASRDRKEVIDLLKENKVPAVIASTIFDEGVDIPSLELVCNAGGGSSERAIIQRIGRANRVDRTLKKDRSIYMDFYDDEPEVLRPQANKRMRHIECRYKGAVKILVKDRVMDLLNGI